MGRLDRGQVPAIRGLDFLCLDIDMHHQTDAPGRTKPPAQDLRWRILDDIATARRDWRLTDRSLAVLRALLTFLPKGERVRLTVFPSNRTLCDRLMGMPESTLRRHLSRLVEAGLIARVSSPNGKRFRIGDDLAFGFDLSGFFAHGQEARSLAEAARMTRNRLRELRQRIRVVMERVAMTAQEQAEMLRLLRRRVSIEELAAELTRLLERLPPKTDVAAAQNDCHIHPNTESERLTAEEADDIEVAMKAIDQVGELNGRLMRTDDDLRQGGEMAARLLAVHEGWTYARQARGIGWAVMALAYVAPRIERLRSPDRYLHALARKAGAGGFDLVAALRRDGFGQCIDACNA